MSHWLAPGGWFNPGTPTFFANETAQTFPQYHIHTVENSLILSFKKYFGKYQLLVEKYYVTCAYLSNDGIADWF